MALPSGISFGPDLRVKLPDRFNVAVPFIDRHLGEGRGAKAAIRTAQETVTYAELAERVNRAGNALLALGLKPGDRLLMVVKDCPAFFYLFWGAIKAGIVPVPPNTLLRAPDYAYMIEDSGCGLVVYSTEFAGEIEPALKQLGAKVAQALTVDAFLAEMAKASAELEARARRADRRLLLALFLGLDRPAQGRGPCPARHGGDQRALRRARAGCREHDISYSAAKLFFAYGLGNAHDLPAVDRQHGGARRPPADARHDLREHRDASSPRSITACRRSMPRSSRPSRPSRAISRRHARLRLGRRGAARRHVPALEGEDRHGDPRRHRLDRGAAHLHRQPARRLPAGHQRQAGAGLRGAASSTRTASRWRRARAARCGSGPNRPPSTTGTSPRRPPRPWSTAGSIPATPTARIPTAISSTRAAATTC